MILIAVAALATALWLAFSWAGPEGGYHAALYRPSSWRDIEFAELWMSSRAMAAGVMVIVAGFAGVLAAQRGRPRSMPSALPMLAGAAIVGCLLVLTGVVRLVYKSDRVLTPGDHPTTTLIVTTEVP